jgi:Fe-S-cluster containining protein
MILGGQLRENTQVIKRAEENVSLIKDMSVEQHIATNIACPLLDSNSGRCVAYEARPSRCRAYNSLDVEVCKKAHIDTSYAEPHPYEMNIAMNSVAYHELVNENLESVGADSNLYEFNGALVEAFKNPSSRDRWLKGKRAFSQKIVSVV